MTAATVAAGAVLAARYRVEAVLGTGGFGTVVAATDLVLGRTVALKLLAVERLGSAETRARFLREAQTLAALAGDHGVQIYDVGALPDGRPFISMERLEGHDLGHELAARGVLPVAEAAGVVIAMCAGLRAVHARGIVHRDLKPANVFLARRPGGAPQIKLLDFGVARVPAAAAITGGDAWIGTPRYMSPEQLTDPGEVGPRADLWALGVILYELVTGHGIFDAPTPAAYASKILTAPPVPLRARDPALPAALEAVVDRCLRPAPGERYPDVDALAAALRRFAPAPGTTATAAPPDAVSTAVETPPRDRPAKGAGAAGRAWLVVAVAGAVGAASAVAVVIASRGGARATEATAAASTDPLVEASAGAAIASVCQGDATAAPRFLVPGNDGPASVQCARLADLGCQGLRRRCLVVAEPAPRQQCEAFLGTLAARTICP